VRGEGKKRRATSPSAFLAILPVASERMRRDEDKCKTVEGMKGKWLENLDDRASQWRKRDVKHSSDRGTDKVTDNRTAEAHGSSVDREQAYLGTDLKEERRRIGGQTGADQEGYRKLMTCIQQTASSDLCMDRDICCVETLPFFQGNKAAICAEF